MALNFPNSPSLNDTYSIGSRKYKWNGYAWELDAVASLAATTDNLLEGTTNKYFSNTNAVSALTGGNLIAIDANGRITSTVTSGATLTGTLQGTTIAGSNVHSSGVLQAQGDATFAGDIHSTSNLFTSGFYREKVVITSDAFPTGNTYDIKDGVVIYHTSDATANANVNITGFANEPAGNSVSLTVLITNGAAAKYVEGVLIDGTDSGVTVKWEGGLVPSGGNSNNVDAYSFSIITTSTNNYTVFANQTQFGG